MSFLKTNRTSGGYNVITLINYRFNALCLSTLLLVMLEAKAVIPVREKKEINIEIGARVRQAREQARMTQERLAERLECSPQFISDMERGVVGISLSTLKKLCLTLGVSSDSILFGTASETTLDALADRCRVLSKEQFAILVEIIEKYIEAVTL